MCYSQDQIIPRNVAVKKANALRGETSGDSVLAMDAVQKDREPRAAVKIAGKRMRLKRGITVDSGAANNVMPRRMVKNKSKIRASPSSIRGVHCVAANNGRIPNEGEFDFDFFTSEGNQDRIIVQIAELNKALGAVSYLADNGYRVVFDKDMATGKDLNFMMKKINGVTSRFRRDRNIWVLDAYVQYDENGIESFHRPA